MEDEVNGGMPFLNRPNEAWVPWALLEAHRRQAMKNHGQTLERLKERGGLSPSEMLAILEDREWRAMDDGLALSAIRALSARKEPE